MVSGMKASRLEVKNLSKEYPGTTALRDFSAVFEGGKVYALLGKNGSGKSTLVKCISGAVTPTSGSIRLDGREARLGSPAEASIRSSPSSWASPWPRTSSSGATRGPPWAR
jgi:ribose transport system ATP-binding protein